MQKLFTQFSFKRLVYNEAGRARFANSLAAVSLNVLCIGAFGVIPPLPGEFNRDVESAVILTGAPRDEIGNLAIVKALDLAGGVDHGFGQPMLLFADSRISGGGCDH